MDCPSEARLVKLTLESMAEIERLAIDLSQRTITVVHRCETRKLTEALEEFGLDATLLSSGAPDNFELASGGQPIRLLYLLIR
jgi:hypothetical protein